MGWWPRYRSGNSVESVSNQQADCYGRPVLVMAGKLLELNLWGCSSSCRLEVVSSVWTQNVPLLSWGYSWAFRAWVCVRLVPQDYHLFFWRGSRYSNHSHLRQTQLCLNVSDRNFLNLAWLQLLLLPVALCSLIATSLLASWSEN